MLKSIVEVFAVFGISVIVNFVMMFMTTQVIFLPITIISFLGIANLLPIAFSFKLYCYLLLLSSIVYSLILIIYYVFKQ